MSMFGKHGSHTDDNPLKSQTERDNDIELDALKLAIRKRNKWKALLLIAPLVMIICLIGTIRLSNHMDAFTSEFASLYKTSISEKPGRQTALQAVNKWMSGSDNPFQSGYTNLWWTGAQLADTKTTVNSGGEGDVTTQYWSHSMVFTDKSDGSTRSITQLVAVTDGICTPVGAPSILPLQAEGADKSGTYTPNTEARIDQPATLQNVVNAWAKAYVGKDANALTVLVGDPNTNHAYQPASVGTWKGASVNWLVQCDEHGKVVTGKASADPKYGAAGLTISFAPYPAAAKDDANQSGSQGSQGTASMSITVLVSQPASGSARIVDWGPDGAVSSLSPYANAVDRNLLGSSSQSADDDVDAATGDDGADTSGEQSDAATPVS